MSADFLADMAAASRARVALARSRCPERELRARATQAPRPPRLSWSGLGFDLIAELKLRSPAAGQLSADADIGARVNAYAEAGAAAISVLTEPTRFDGSLEQLALAVRRLGGRVPVMRKDFLVDPYQVLEARIAGAGGVLLIVRMLSADEIGALLEAAVQAELFVLLEAFDESDVARALQSAQGADRNLQLLLGVNCRDLSNLQVVPGRLETLAAQLPRELPRVAESGVSTAEDAARLVRAGYDAALVGSALMRSDAPLELARSMLAAGRAAAAATRRSCG